MKNVNIEIQGAILSEDQQEVVVSKIMEGIKERGMDGVDFGLDYPSQDYLPMFPDRAWDEQFKRHCYEQRCDDIVSGFAKGMLIGFVLFVGYLLGAYVQWL